MLLFFFKIADIGSSSIFDILHGVKVLLLAVWIKSLALVFNGLLIVLVYFDTCVVLTKELGALLFLRRSISYLSEAMVY